MKEFKGTKGQWIVKEYNNRKLIDRFHIHSDSENIISTLRTDYPNAKVGKANAQLIAAAPEMLQVLAKFLDLFSEYDMRPEDEMYEYAEEVQNIVDKALNIES